MKTNTTQQERVHMFIVETNEYGWAGAANTNWRPAVAGTVNQTNLGDDEASRAETLEKAEELVAFLVKMGADRDSLRITEL